MVKNCHRSVNSFLTMSKLKKFFHRGRIQNASNIQRSGMVQKLVLKDSWNERRWNVRWLEIHSDSLRYLQEEGDPQPIDDIPAANIPQVACIIGDGLEHNVRERTFMSKGSGKLMFPATPVRDTVVAHANNHQEELRTCFYLMSHAADGTSREYVFRVESESRCRSWVTQIKQMIAEARPRPPSIFQRMRQWVHAVFHSRLFQILVTLLIALNFLAFIYIAQVSISVGKTACAHSRYLQAIASIFNRCQHPLCLLI